MNVSDIIPDLTDCNNYFTCDPPIRRPCPSGLSFNYELRMCDFSEKVPGCSEGFYTTVRDSTAPSTVTCADPSSDCSDSTTTFTPEQTTTPSEVPTRDSTSTSTYVDMSTDSSIDFTTTTPESTTTPSEETTRDSTSTSTYVDISTDSSIDFTTTTIPTTETEPTTQS